MTTSPDSMQRGAAHTSAGAARIGSSRLTGQVRGFTGVGGASVLAFLAAAGAGLDALLTGRLGWFFAAGFVAACCWVALRIRAGDRATALVAAPLVYAGIVVLASQIGGAGGSAAERSIDAVVGLAKSAPILATGLVLAAVILLLRRRYTRRT